MWFDVASNGQNAIVHLQRYDAEGVKVGAESIVTVPAIVNEPATIVALATGGFAISWYGSMQPVTVQTFTADGTRLGDLALDWLGTYDMAPSMAALPSGGLAVAWGQNGNLAGNMIDASGAIATTFKLNGGGFDNQPSVVGLSNNRFVVLWNDQSGLNGDPDGGLLGQLFNAAGQKAGSSFLVNTSTPGSQWDADAAAFDDGSFVVSWTENDVDGGIRAQRFDNRGTKIGGEIVVSTLTPNYQSNSSVVALPFGGFLVAWEDYSRADGDHEDPSIRAQLFDSDGTRLGDEIRLNMQTTHAEASPVLTLQSPTTVIATWLDNGSYNSSGGMVHATLALPMVGTNGADTLVAVRPDEILLGRGGADHIYGGDGNNVIDGGAGADRMEGGMGDDIYVVDNSGDIVLERDGNGLDTVNASASFSLAGQYVEVLNLTGTAAINGSGNSLDNRITGNAAANILIGGAGNDRLDGGAGADTLKGGLGDDVYVVDQAGDQIVENDGEGIDTVEAYSSYSIAGQYIEILKLLGTGNFSATGSGIANILYGNAGDNLLDGGGGADKMYGGVGDDVYVVDNAGDRVFENPYEGVDTVRSSVSFSIAGQYIENLTLTGVAATHGTGNSLDNILTGNDAANALNGAGGSDALHGGLGSDTLTGGAGQDGFWFETVLGAGNVDTVTDFSVAEDTIYLDRTIFAGIAADGALDPNAFWQGTTAHEADDRIVYDESTGKIWYDADGSGAGAAVLFAQVTANTALTAADFLAVA